MDENDTVTKEELGFFINELLKSQIKELQSRIEKEQYTKQA